MAFGRLDQMETRKTVKMQVKVPNGRATPCGTAVTDAARDIIFAVEKYGKPEHLFPALDQANLVLEHARHGNWRIAVSALQNATAWLDKWSGRKK